MYIHCRDCSWAQDDFMNRHYNPITKAKHHFDVIGFANRGAVVDVLTMLSLIILNTANMLSMKWITYKQYKRDKNKVCPKCKSHNLTID